MSREFLSSLRPPRLRVFHARSLPVPSLFLVLSLLLISSLPACSGLQRGDWSGTQVSGRLTDTSGTPVPGAYVYAYDANRGNRNIMGPADAMSDPSGTDGSYLLVLPEGTYILAARKRLSGSLSGPLRNGDLYGQATAPLRVGPRGSSDRNLVLRVFSQGAEGDPKRILTTDTRVKGVVVDREGRPVQGIHVFAYEGSFRSDPPDFLAPATDHEGRFEISLPGGGPYTLGARSGLRGKPRLADSLGFWDEEREPREIPEGAVTEGVRIVVEPYGDTGSR